MIKILCGGSPCTHWSIAQKNNRETTAEGIGWELFKNFLIAKEKFRPDYYLYENNKSAAQPIKDQIAKEFGVTERSIFSQDNGVRMTYINSALVSAQNRQRFYVTNFGDIEQPADRGILLRDILEAGNPANCASNDKARPINVGYDRVELIKWYDRVYNENPCKQQHDYIAEPVCVAQRGRYRDTGSRGKKTDDEIDQYYEAREDGKINALTTVGKDNAVAEPIRIGTLPNEKGELHDSQAVRIYSVDGKSVNLVSGGGGQGAKTGLYAEPIECMPVREATKQGYTIVEPGDCVDLTQPNSETRRGRNMADKCNCLTTGMQYYQHCGTIDKPIYEVRNGLITIKDKQYPIKLRDGYYIIRKLTVKECCRLQTMPDDYCRAVSSTQAYKGLGNGWTAEVIIHLLNHTLKNVPRDTEIECLAMYDGIGTGHYCLDKMGFKHVRYHAYEIDKYAMQVAMSNYPDIVQHGDAFQVREEEWHL